MKEAEQTQLDQQFLTAARGRKVDQVNQLIKDGANINAKDSHYLDIFLYDAARNDQIELVKVLINNEAYNGEGCADLRLAAETGQTGLVKYLIENKKHVVSGSNGWTALHYTAESGNTELAKVLIKSKVDINAECNGWTPLHLAVYNGHTDVVKTLIKNKADVNAKYYHWTPLSVVVYYGGNSGWTPLHLAAANGHLEVVKTLLENEANPLLKDSDGKTPRDLAEDENITQLLKKAEETQLMKNAIVKGTVAGFVIAAIVATALTFATTLSAPIIIGLAIGSALIASTVVGAGICMMSKPKTEMGVKQVAPKNMQEMSA